MKAFALPALTVALILGVSATHATPLVGTISNAGNYSVIHDGSSPAGSGERALWRWFDDDQTIMLDLTDGMLTLAGAQTFSLTVPATEARATVTFLEMTLNLNDADGFAGGSIVYTTDSIPFGVFGFDDRRYGSSPFNSSTLHDGMLEVFVWGGDRRHDLDIDLALRAAVPEPSVTTLLLVGLFGLLSALFAGRRRAAGWLATDRGCAATPER